MSNTYKLGYRFSFYRNIKHRQRLLIYLVDRMKRNRLYKNRKIDTEIKEGSYSDTRLQKPQNNKNKKSRREQIRRLRKQKEQQRRLNNG